MAVPNRHETIDVAIGQRAEQHGFDDAEDRGRRPDAKRQRHHRDDGEARTLAQQPRGETEIVNGVTDQTSHRDLPPLLDGALADLASRIEDRRRSIPAPGSPRRGGHQTLARRRRLAPPWRRPLHA